MAPRGTDDGSWRDTRPVGRAGGEGWQQALTPSGRTSLLYTPASRAFKQGWGYLGGEDEVVFQPQLGGRLRLRHSGSPCGAAGHACRAGMVGSLSQDGFSVVVLVNTIQLRKLGTILYTT